ncbi:FAD-dependent oxidoreductase [Streptomyces sp. NPDC101225]|uniref:FAD-dependent oxidoreductase n=1 Tax=Streptomyces sp. NPDC101225 TaxID=3366135 RepID=UPI00382B0F42
MPDGRVVVTGAGPVGLLAALGLAQAGVDVTVWEARPRIAPLPYDMVYDSSVLPGFEQLGVLGELRREGVAARSLSFRVPCTGESIVLGLDALTGAVEYPYNLHVPPHVLTRVVADRLSALPHARIEWGTRLTGLEQDAHGVTLVSDSPDGTRTLRSQWLVGADGAHSQVRRSLGMGFPGMTWPNRFVAAGLRVDLATLGFSPESCQIDPEHGALVGLVDPTGLWRYIYAESRMLPEESLVDRMPAALKAGLPDGIDQTVESWSAFRVHERAAERLRAGRVILAGDAAHVTNPTRALGMACGVFDAFTLARALAPVVRGEADENALDRWAEDRLRAFRETASPLSSETMRFLFHTNDEARLHSGIECYRRMAADPGLCRDYLLSGRELDGPPSY